MLVGTTSVERSEALAAMLQQEGAGLLRRSLFTVLRAGLHGASMRLRNNVSYVDQCSRSVTCRQLPCACSVHALHGLHLLQQLHQVCWHSAS